MPRWLTQDLTCVSQLSSHHLLVSCTLCLPWRTILPNIPGLEVDLAVDLVVDQAVDQAVDLVATAAAVGLTAEPALQQLPLVTVQMSKLT